MKSQHSMFRSVAARPSGAHPARVKRLSALRMRCVQTPTEAMLPHIHIPREHESLPPLLHGEAKCRPRMIRLRSAQSAPPVVPAPMLGRVSRTAVTHADRPGWTKQYKSQEKVGNSPTPLPTMDLFTLTSIFPVGSEPVRAAIPPAPGPPRHMRV